MANTLLTPTVILNETLMVYHQQANFLKTINRSYDDKFAKEGGKIGSTLTIRKPNKFVVRTGNAMNVQDMTEPSEVLTVATLKGVDMEFSHVDLSLTIDRFSERYIKPAVAALVANVESDAMSMKLDIYQQAKMATITAAADFGLLLDGKQILDEMVIPTATRTANLAPRNTNDLVDALKGLFHESTAIKEQYSEGMMGRTAGFDFYQNSLWTRHTRGAANTAYTTDTRTSALPVSATPVASITVASGSGNWSKGEVFTIAGVFKVHPESKANTGILQQFAIRTASAGGAGTIDITPSIILDGAYQNVTVSPAAGSATAAIVIDGTLSKNYDQSLLYHKDAFAFVTADLPLPTNAAFAARNVLDGVSMRIWKADDITNNTQPCRLDILYGFKTIRAEAAVRLASNGDA